MTNSPDTVVARPTRLQIMLWVVILLAMLALSLYDWNGYQVGTYGDDGSYVTNTDSLLQGVSYGNLLSPGESRISQFPFLLPLMLAPLRALFPRSLDALRILPLVCTVLAVTIFFWGWRWIGRGLSYWWGLAALVITALSPLTILHARTIMSEAPFLLFTLLMIVLLEKIIVAPPRAWGIWLGSLMVAVMYVRTIGWMFVIVWLAYLLWKRGRTVLPQLGVAFATGAVILIAVLLTTTVRPIDLLPQEYLVQFSKYLHGGVPVDTGSARVDVVGVSKTGFVESVLGSVLVHLDFADKLPFQMEYPIRNWTDAAGLRFLRYIPGIVGVALVAYGAFLWFRKTGLTAFQLIVIPYLGLLSFWPWNGPRLFYPVQPQLVLAALLGLYGVAHWLVSCLQLQSRAPRLAGQFIAATVLVVALACVWLDLRFTRTMLLPGDQFLRAAQVQAVVPADAIILSSRATTDHLYFQRTLINIPFRTNSTREIVELLKLQNISYIVSHNGLNASAENDRLRIGSFNRFVTALQPLVTAGVLETKFVDEPNDLVIYRVKTDALKSFQP